MLKFEYIASYIAGQLALLGHAYKSKAKFGLYGTYIAKWLLNNINFVTLLYCSYIAK